MSDPLMKQPEAMSGDAKGCLVTAIILASLVVLLLWAKSGDEQRRLQKHCAKHHYQQYKQEADIKAMQNGFDPTHTRRSVAEAKDYLKNCVDYHNRMECTTWNWDSDCRGDKR